MLILGLLVASIAGYWGYKTFLKSKGSVTAFASVPSDAIFVATTSDLSKAWNTLSKSQFWNYLKTTQYFADINEDIEMVDGFLKDSKLADKLLNGRELVLAGLETENHTWDMVYLIDLKNFSSAFDEYATSLKLVKGYKFEQNTYSPGGENAQNYRIFTLTDQTDPDFQIHLTLADNLLLVSLDKKLVFKVINEFNNGYWANNNNFQEVSGEFANNSLLNLFINYKAVPKLYSMYSTDPSEGMDMISQSLVCSVLGLELYDDQIVLNGSTALDSVYSYLRAFSNVGTGKTRAYNILSDQTAVYMSLQFNDFDKFYNELTEEYARGNKADWDDMQKLMKTTEKLLGFSIKEDFLGWIGTEITIAKLRPLSEKSRDIDAAVLISASNIDNAKAHLGNMFDHIQKRTPLKFRIQPYRNFDIKYLDINGFFKMFFGKLFAKIEKPYFTYIEDFVVFANNEEVLHQIIDDYLVGRTMIKSVKFENFKDAFDNKANLTAYIQTPKMYETLLKYSPSDMKKDIEDNREIINSFARFGFQLTNSNGRFKSRLAIQYDSTANQEDIALQMESMAEGSLEIPDLDSLKFKVPGADGLEDGPQKIMYDTLETVHYDGIIQNGGINGIWRTYYPSGNIFVTANYMQGYLNGKAYFYQDSRKQTLLAEVEYNMDKIQGYYIEYYPNGNMKAKIEYDKGVRNGECQYFWENGNVKMQMKYKKGERSGKSTVYNDKGKKIGKLDTDYY
ncbi:MAG: toxin-antitoxin system YwqK family antitoxin [Bacteroidales bacterium]|nr:toxin-antitoxin system YwqK family antitoxin [Bacteroidales bacterium]